MAGEALAVGARVTLRLAAGEVSGVDALLAT
jgi:hypothetical protein